MKKTIIIGFLVSVLSILFFSFKNQETGKLEKWTSLFNGVNLNGWIVKINGYPVNENIHNTFRVEDSILKVSYNDYENFGKAYGHIFYKTPFSNYRLKLQYRFVGNQAPGGQPWAYKNSGIMIHSQSPESMGIDQEFPVSLEVQLLGGIKHGIERHTGNLCTPGTHVEKDGKLITEHCINSTSKTYYDAAWITTEITVYNDSLIIHSIDGKEVLRYSKPVYGGEYLPDTNYWKAKQGQPVTGGYISLQSESHPVEFRKIELLELK